MKVKQFEGITYEEHHNIMFGDYVKISLRDWETIQDCFQNKLQIGEQILQGYNAGYQDGYMDGMNDTEYYQSIRPNY